MIELTQEKAQFERRQILADVQYHRNAAKRRMRDLERLEADCARHGIRLIREPVGRKAGPDGRANPHAR